MHVQSQALLTSEQREPPVRTCFNRLETRFRSSEAVTDLRLLLGLVLEHVLKIAVHC